MLLVQGQFDLILMSNTNMYRYVENPNGRQASFELSEHYMIQSRSELDVDDPSIDSIQTCLLLVLAFKAAGKGRKAYMIMGTSATFFTFMVLTRLAAGIGMITALELSRESGEMLSTQEREMRRRLFWACYIMDRFISCGSKRPSLITDDSILLRLPAWYPYTTRPPVDGEFFHSGSNLQYHAGGRRGQGSNGLLIDIVRILGITNKYLAAGGVKGDSHFPWHALSNLSKIRQDLDTWASGTQGAFASVDALFGQPDSTTVVLSKLVYHLIHCLVYRPFLPIDLAELAGNGQQQSWQIEATNLCFLHANAIAELVDLGQSTSIEWPAFTGYCVFTAATVHIHGAHYAHGQRGDVFTSSSDFLLQEVSQLSSLQSTWALIQHHRTALQTIINCHSELIKTLDIDPMRYAPVFHLEDFFDRYSTLGHSIEGAHIVFSELGTVTQDGPSGENDFQGSITLIDRAGRSQLKRASSFSQPKRQSNDQSIGDAMSQSSNVAYQALQSAPVVRQPYTQYQSHAASISAITINTQSLAGSSSSSTNFFPLPHLPLHADVSYDPMLSISQVPDAPYGFDMNGNPVSTVITPGGRSQQSISTSHQEDKEEVDPFLTLLEQLAENEYSRGGPSELDYFLTTSE